MRRLAFGILALIFIAIGVYFGFQPPDGIEQWLHAVLIRIGLVLGAAWLAYPELSCIPKWLYGVLAVAIVIVMIRPKLIIIVAPVVVAIWMFWPKKKSRA